MSLRPAWLHGEFHTSCSIESNWFKDWEPHVLAFTAKKILSGCYGEKAL